MFMVVSRTGKTLLTFLKPFLNRQKWKRPQAHKALQNIINTLYAYSLCSLYVKFLFSAKVFHKYIKVQHIPTLKYKII